MIDFGEKLNKDVLDLIEDIKEYWLLSSAAKEFFQYTLFPAGMAVENIQDSVKAQAIVDKKRKILEKLQHLGVLDAKTNEDSLDAYGSDFLLKVNKEKFEEVFTDLKNKIASISIINEGKTILYFDIDANLYVDSKDGLCYSIEKGSKREKILNYLVDNKTEYQSARDIADHAGYEDPQNLRSELHKIRENIEKFLQLDDVIESNRNSGGYRINPTYKILKSSK